MAIKHRVFPAIVEVDLDTRLRLLCVLAHPDDESLGTGSTLAKYRSEGVETFLVTATRGERGWNGPPEQNPGLQALGRTRTAELEAAAAVLGLQEVNYLNYIDGDLDQADPPEVIGKIVTHIRRIKPHVVITFGPDGVYGHPDHIAISQFTTAAVMCAANRGFCDPDGLSPHPVAKLYYLTTSCDLLVSYKNAFNEMCMPVDGVDRKAVMWEDWAHSAAIDGGNLWRATLQAIRCHKSQLAPYGDLDKIPEELHRRLWAKRTYYRAFSLVNSGRKLETDLFEGLHWPAQVYIKDFASVEECV
jgi:LmbE family N-acetylglucosaminyl deacetylase